MDVESAPDTSASTSSSTMTVGEFRIALTVTERDDAHVARGMFERFARRHGATPTRVGALEDAGSELCRALLVHAGGGLLEAERVGSFIEVRAMGRDRPPQADGHAPTGAEAVDTGLSVALSAMDGIERSDSSRARFMVRTWCELE